MELRFFIEPISFETRTNKPPVLKGLASVYYDGTPGTQYQLTKNIIERIKPGAFTAFLRSKPRVQCFFNHDTSKPMADTEDGTLNVWESNRGLQYEATVDWDLSYVKDAEVHIRKGKMKGSSFGLVPVNQEWQREGDQNIRLITEAKAVEVSPVFNPAYAATETAVRQLESYNERELARLYYEIATKRLNSINGPK